MSAMSVRHPVSLICRCRELRESGWSSNKIVTFIEREHGIRVSRQSVMRWTEPAYAERVKAQVKAGNRKRLARTWTFRLSGAATSTEYRSAFMRRLRDEGVPCSSIAKVCSVVFGERISADRVRKTLGDPR